MFKNWMNYLILGVSIFISSLAVSHSYALTPGHQRTDAPVISPTDARKILSVHSISILKSKGDEKTPIEIKALARGLKHNVDLIYQFVHDHIEYTPIFGALKGPLGTLRDKCGNDFDQAALMVALLKESGYEADYIFGQIKLNPTQVEAWLGIDPNAGGLGYLLGSSGIPGVPYFYPDNTLAFLIASHVWVRVNIEGTYYVFDPSFKQHDIIDGMDLASVSGYDKTTFISNALSGAVTGADYMQGINKAALSSSLSLYSQNLIHHIQTSAPTATINEVVGGKEIIPLSHDEQLRQTSLPYQESVDEQWASIPDSYRTTLRIQHVGIDQTFFTDEIYGKRLTIFYNGSMQPELRLDGQLIATGNSVGSGSYQNIIVSVDHPYAAYGGTYCDDSRTFQIEAGGSYVVVNGWAETTRGMVETHRRLLKEAMFHNSDVTSEPVLGESLEMIAYMWLAECSMSDQLMDRVAHTVTIHHHMLGVCGQNRSPYIDMPMCLVSTISEDGDENRASAAFFVSSGHHSALEWGVIDQLQPYSAVSTVKLLDIANDESDKLFDADSSNFSSIIPQLRNYSSYELSNVQMYINAGYRVLLPENGDLGEGEWSGIGFLTISPDEQQIGHIIAGGLNGGYAIIDAIVQGISTIFDWFSSNHPKKNEPIDFLTGDYLYDHTDLTVGNGRFPYQLAFTRHYNSGAGLDRGPLGLGWVHNFALSAEQDSDGFQGLGEDSPIDAASAIVECMVSIDLLDGAKTSDAILISTLSHRWAMDHLIDNIVTVAEPGMTSKFLRLPDGTFNPPPGVASTLTVRSEGGYILKTSHGNVMEFDSDGKIISWTDSNGNGATFIYEDGRLVSVSNGMGRSLAMTYNADGLLVQVADQGGHSAGFSYDEQGHLTQVTDPESHATRFEYDDAGRISSIYYPFRAENPYVTNIYDELGRVATQTNANGSTYTYYMTGYRSEEVDPLGNSAISYFDNRGKTEAERDQLGNMTTYSYDGLERLIKKTMPEGDYIQYQYDRNHNIIRITRSPRIGFADPPLIEEFSYDLTYNKPLSYKDTLGRVNSFEYDGKGNLTKITRPAVDDTFPVLSFTYNSRGQILSATDPEGMVTTYSYDAATGDMLSVTKDAGGFNITDSFSYDQFGNILQKTDPLNRITSYQYNNKRQIVSMTDPLNHETRFFYDEDGHVVKVEKETGDTLWPWQTMTITYTDSAQIASITDPQGHVTVFDYDALDRKWKVTDPLGRTTETLYDETGRIWRVINPAGNLDRELTYTSNGQLANLKDPNGNITAYEYDAFDRPFRAVYPDGSYEQFAFDPAGNLTRKITRSGQTIDFSYDVLNRLISKTVPGPKFVHYQYDLTGRLIQVADEHGAISFNFDTAGRLSQVTYPDSRTVSYEYDLIGNRTMLTYPDGYFVAYTYDSLNRLTAVLESGTSVLASYSYDSLSRRIGLTYGNGTNTQYSYETDNDLSQIIHRFTGDLSVTFDYTYNEVGNRTGLSVNDDPFLFNPLAAIEEEYVSNVLNQYTSVAGRLFSYDGNGNLTSDGINTYSYDAENRLISASTSDHNLTFSYDAFGRRIVKDVDGQVTTYLYDGDQVLIEYDGSGHELRRFVYGPGIDQPVCMITAVAKYYYHFNALGSVVALSDDSGNIAEIYAYSPYGILSSISTVGNPYYFTGRRLDAETGLYYYRARYYNPAIGKFMQVDPIGYAGGMNLYAYVGGDPVDWVDPFGLWTLQIGLSGTAGAGAGVTAGTGIVFGFSWDNGFQFGTYEVFGGGGFGGVSGSGVVDITFSTNTDINDLSGLAGTVGGSGGEGISIGGEINIPEGTAAPSWTFSIGFGGGTPIEQHGFVTNTWIQEWTNQK